MARRGTEQQGQPDVCAVEARAAGFGSSSDFAAEPGEKNIAVPITFSAPAQWQLGQTAGSSAREKERFSSKLVSHVGQANW